MTGKIVITNKVGTFGIKLWGWRISLTSSIYVACNVVEVSREAATKRARDFAGILNIKLEDTSDE